MPEETIDYKAAYEQAAAENRDWYTREKMREYYLKTHWMIGIPKIDVLSKVKVDLSVLNTTDPHKLYFYTLIVCTILATAIDCYVALARGIEK